MHENCSNEKGGDVHASQLTTKADLADAKTEIIKWTIGAMFAAVGMFAAIVKLMA